MRANGNGDSPPSGRGAARTVGRERQVGDSPLRRLIRGAGIRTFFQPIFAIDDATQPAFAHEALSRGTSGTPFESAAELFAAARRESRELAIDRLCATLALAAARALPATSRVAINFHARTLAHDRALPSFLDEAAERAGIGLDRIIVELIEHLHESDVDRAATQLDRLRSRGVQVAMDDFGAGGARLFLLRSLAPDYVKLDRQILVQARGDVEKQATMTSIIRYARGFGTAAVVEGVETAEDLAIAHAAGAAYVQGFHLGVPREAEPVPSTRVHLAPAATTAPEPTAATTTSHDPREEARWASLRELDQPLLRVAATGILLDLNDAALTMLSDAAAAHVGNPVSEVLLSPGPARLRGNPLEGLPAGGRELVWALPGEGRRSVRVRQAVRGDAACGIYLVEAATDPRHWMGPELFEHFSQGIRDQALLVLTPSGAVVSWNEGAEALLGYTPEEVEHQAFDVLWAAPGQPGPSLERILGLATAGSGWQGEITLRDDGGRDRPVHLTLLPLRDAEGRSRAFAGFVLDLTERRAAEQRAAAHETLLRGITDTVPGAIYQLVRRGDGTALFSYLSVGFERLFGVPVGSIRGIADLRRHVTDEDRTAIGIKVALARATRSAWSHDFPVRRPDGQLLWLRATSALLEGTAPDEETWNGLVLDVSEHRALEQSIVLARNEWAATVDAVDDLIVLEDGEGVVLRCNRAFAEFHRRPLPGLVGERMVPLFFGADAGPAELTLFRGPRCSVRFPGRDAWFEISNFPIPGGTQRRTCWVHVIANVSERRRLEDRAARITAAIDQADEAVLILDAGGSVEYANSTTTSLLGVAAGSLFGRSIGESGLRPRERRALREIRDSLRDGSAWSGELSVRVDDGGLRRLEVSVSPVRGESGELRNAVIVARNVSERSRHDDIAEAIQTADQTGLLFATLRQELSNPINSLKAALGILRRRGDEAPPELVTGWLDRGLTEIARVEHLLRLFRVFSIHEQPRIEQVEMRSFLEHFGRLVRGRVHQHGAALEIRLDGNAGRGRFDPRAMSQALHSLITNSVEALEGRPNPRVTITVERNGDRLTVAVHDNGCGFDPADLEKSFEPFRTTRRDGSGLGLAIVRRLLSRMDGKVELHSVPAMGTVVRIDLPADPDRT